MELHYPSSENKGADKLRSYCEADLHLWFRIVQIVVVVILIRRLKYLIMTSKISLHCVVVFQIHVLGCFCFREKKFDGRQ